MTLEHDLRRECYLILIPREEMKRIFKRAWDYAEECGCTTDELVAKELYERILNLINSDLREKETE